jgi:hypothetical protein
MAGLWDLRPLHGSESFRESPPSLSENDWREADVIISGMSQDEEEDSLLVHLLRWAKWGRLLDPNSNRLPV